MLSSAEIQFNNYTSENKELLEFTRKALEANQKLIADAEALSTRLAKQYDALRKMQEVIVEFKSEVK